MTAIPISRQGNQHSGFFLLFAVVFLVIGAAGIHAIGRHGEAQVAKATEQLQSADPNGPDWWQKTCPDGRVYTFQDLGDGTWNVSIDTPQGRNITRFSTDRAEWVEGRKAWCNEG